MRAPVHLFGQRKREVLRYTGLRRIRLFAVALPRCLWCLAVSAGLTYIAAFMVVAQLACSNTSRVRCASWFNCWPLMSLRLLVQVHLRDDSSVHCMWVCLCVYGWSFSWPHPSILWKWSYAFAAASCSINILFYSPPSVRLVHVNTRCVVQNAMKREQSNEGEHPNGTKIVL